MWRELAWSDDSEAHIAKHNVTPSEVEEVVNSRPQWEHPGVADSTLIYGRTARSAERVTDAMSRKTTLDRLAEHYDGADTAVELEDASAASPPDPPATTERMTTFAVRLPVMALDHVREVAAQRHVTTSALIRSWIEAGIADDGCDTEGRVVRVQALLELIARAPRESAGH